MQTIDKHFRTLAKAAFERHGFANEQLVSGWAAIVGADMAAISAPDKIKWPRISVNNTRQIGGTLVLRAAAGRGLELHYEAPRIIERVNQYLGYGAITTLKVVQSGLPMKQPPIPRKPMKPEAAKAWAAKFEDIADEDLKAALARLARFTAPNGPKLTFSTGEIRVLSHPPTSSRKNT